LKALPWPIAALLVTSAAAGAVLVDRAVTPPHATPSCRLGATTMARLELLFGLGNTDGSTVTEAAWQSFLATEVTPRFPDGLTVLTAYGQWKGPNGVLSKESSRVLVIWYTYTTDANAAIELIRQAYKARFGQASVMRVDGRSCVAF
jgi:hypothetical protein